MTNVAAFVSHIFTIYYLKITHAENYLQVTIDVTVTSNHQHHTAHYKQQQPASQSLNDQLRRARVDHWVDGSLELISEPHDGCAAISPK